MLNHKAWFCYIFIMLATFRCWADGDNVETKSELAGRGSVPFSLNRYYSDGNSMHIGDNVYAWRKDYITPPGITVTGQLYFEARSKDKDTQYPWDEANYLKCVVNTSLDAIPPAKQIVSTKRCRSYKDVNASADFYAKTATVTGTLNITNATSRAQQWKRSFYTRYGNNQDVWTLYGVVPAHHACTIEVDTPRVRIPDFSASEVERVNTGEDMPWKTAQFMITTMCTTNSPYTLSFITQRVGGSCIGSDNGVLRFCLEAELKRLNFSSGVATLKGSNSAEGKSTTVRIIPQKGTSPSIAGKSTGVITITIEPG